MLKLTLGEFVERKDNLKKKLKALVKGEFTRIIYGTPDVHSERGGRYYQITYVPDVPRGNLFTIAKVFGVNTEVLGGADTAKYTLAGAMREIDKDQFANIPETWAALPAERKAELLAEMYNSNWYGVKE